MKYKEFLEEIKKFKILDNITASVLTIEDVDPNYRENIQNGLLMPVLERRSL